MPTRRKRIKSRISDIALAAGVSMMTVSRALRGIEGVSERKRAEILEIAHRLNYVPNSNARAMSAANSNLIGISLPTFANDVFADILFGMRNTFDTANYSSVIDTTEYNPETELAFARRLMTWNPAAIILTGVDHHPDLRVTLQEAGIPTLEIWDYCKDPIDINVGFDHEAAGVMIGEHVAALGYRRPAFVGAPKGRDTRADGRLAGLRRVFSQVRGAEPFRTARPVIESTFGAGHAGTVELLAGEQPDVIFYLNDHMAFGGQVACEAKGLSVPHDIGLVGFNALDLSGVLPVPLTTVKTPRRLMGITGARNLLARIHGVQPQKSVALPVEIVEGGTTRLQ